MREMLQKTLRNLLSLFGKIFVKTVNTERLLIDYASRKYTIEELAKKHKEAARFLRKYCGILCERRVSNEEAILFFTEYRNLMYAIQTGDTKLLSIDIERHQMAKEYEELADYVFGHTGQSFIFMYSPVLLRALKMSACGVFNIHFGNSLIVVYDDIFKKISETDRKCFALHEAGHVYYKHFELNQGECDHEAFGDAKVPELEADDYASYIVGSDNMKRALINAHYRTSFISRLMNKKELRHRLKELNS